MKKILKNVLFICHGNICRSPMAEFVMKDMLKKNEIEGVTVESAATSREEIGKDVHRGTRQKLDEQGIPWEHRGAWQITKKDYDKYDYLIVMDQNNIRNALRIFGEDPSGKIRSLLSFAGIDGDIADPWYTGNFDETYEDVVKGCTELVKELSEKLK